MRLNEIDRHPLEAKVLYNIAKTELCSPYLNMEYFNVPAIDIILPINSLLKQELIELFPDQRDPAPVYFRYRATDKAIEMFGL